MTDNLITSRSVGHFFHDALNSALSNQHVEATPDAVHYVVRVLTEFSRTDRLYDKSDHGDGVKPLALIYADAVHSSDPTERGHALRRLGDMALFISGFFASSLDRKLVDVEYYMAMGGSAYAQLSSSPVQGISRTGLATVFSELSQKFSEFVDALAEVGQDANFSNDSDLLRCYENWLRTGNQRSAQQLRRAGIVPVDSHSSRTRH